MNEKHPPGRRSTCIDDLCARVEALEKENKMLRDASENAHQPAPAPQDGPPEQTAAHDAPATAEARSEALSVSSIRAIAARGDPVTAGQVAWLCDEAERDVLRATSQDRIDRLTADVGAWWWIVNDLNELGCLDCSNNACDRARQALVATHPGKSLLSLLVIARAWAGAIERQDIAEIERCANELILAIARCS